MKIKLTSNKQVYNYSTPYIIAEIGANHNGDMDLAKKMILAAKNCGADAVKFQSWNKDSLISESEYQKNQTYDDSPKKHFGSLKAMVEKYYLRPDQHLELKEYCDEIGVDFNSTPFSIEEADLLNDLGVEFFKISSMDINNLSLIRHVAKFNKPMVLSTGMANLSEIESAVSIIEAENNFNIVLLHCISIYPPEYKDINLNNISMLQKAFDYPIGFSDHSIGSSIPLASVAIGACVIEKHFTTDKNLPGWDHAISADIDEMKLICKESKNIAIAMGSFARIVSPDEQEKKLKFRRSVVVAGDLESGHILKESDLLFKRPGTGISPDESKYVIGRQLKNSVANDSILSWADLV